MRYFLRFLLMLSVLMVSANSFAQGAGGGKEDPIIADTMQSVWIVTGVAAAGAVIGLSTLSFVDEPSENLKNIVTGGAIGVIIGVGVVAYMQATKSKEMYQYGIYLRPETSDEHFSTLMRTDWHNDNFVSRQAPQFPSLQFSKTF